MIVKGGVRRVSGELRVPSDKSVSHRASIFGALAKGTTYVEKWLVSADTQATLKILRALGTKIFRKGDSLRIEGRDFNFSEPVNVLDARNSGTTARIMMGVLSTQNFFSVITGDRSLRRRPMLRVVDPLRKMGAKIEGREEGNLLPVAVKGGNLKGISFFNRRSSAQVKTSLLLAGLRAEGKTEVIEPVRSRDHTERMLKSFGVNLSTSSKDWGYIVEVEGGQSLTATHITCPADPSSGAFFVALTILAGGELLLKDLLINPTRTGFLKKVKEMGAEVKYENVRQEAGEEVADVIVRGGTELKGVRVSAEEIPSMVDEIPILAVMMALAKGVSEVRGAQELRVKESDRIRAVVENLRAMGAKVEELEDGFVVEGMEKLKGARIKTYHDHRIAMAFTVAGLIAEGETVIDDPSCVAVSYPSFFKDLEKIVER